MRSGADFTTTATATNNNNNNDNKNKINNKQYQQLLQFQQKQASSNVQKSLLSGGAQSEKDMSSILAGRSVISTNKIVKMLLKAETERTSQSQQSKQLQQFKQQVEWDGIVGLLEQEQVPRASWMHCSCFLLLRLLLLLWLSFVGTVDVVVEFSPPPFVHSIVKTAAVIVLIAFLPSLSCSFCCFALLLFGYWGTWNVAFVLKPT